MDRFPFLHLPKSSRPARPKRALGSLFSEFTRHRRALSRPLQSSLTPSIRNLRIVTGLVLFVGLSAAPGCRRAAFNEFYVENMAGEIRALEDRIYEYDSAYTALELENEDLRQAIADLRNKNYAPTTSGGNGTNPNGWGSAPGELNLLPRNQRSSGKLKSGGVELGPNAIDSTTDDLGTGDPTSGQGVEEIDLSPKSSKPKKPPVAAPSNQLQKPKHSVLLEDTAPEPLAKPPATFPKGSRVEPAPDFPLLPEASGGLESNGSTEDELPPPVTNPGFPKSNGSSSGGKPPQPSDLDLDFEMPTSVRGRGGKPLGSNGPNKRPDSKQIVQLPDLTQTAIDKGKINLPIDPNVIPASVQLPVSNRVRDQKLVEVGFHPTLSRGHNFDEKPGDDGLYLVITPLNSRGEVLNVFGNLTIVIEESKEDLSRRIAAWEVTPEELKESLEPIGSSQGFHLSLPWDDVVPEGNQVQVFLKYALPDGRTLVNRKDIQLRKPGSRQTSWTPR